ncbi:NDP-sugar epimerase, includes UDP-GlcNAc-inverting 4,6-dehydratase FlaA1 and capsular polysaccharide biosynthesis protein EpsC [Syntrophus gentianae]|uniref:NDP-sugar epimerase, includes UDP-GlcNAc-inverting 4,6-dehydratase FlaA1 and capsular polysaccharide biosynthesis protein EpsC n=2 Tax=Syntrophus gentianae TaxID=43775 RepID=A0A1H7V8E7_9BACT|nr:NDP-sugar epimerase, includes UDP-GlcNAc-inverting 4,6-dehydratase FlaA1 and capsular polysaccharide biosynthesis protein EpsC [Syntrophus gentianae]
MKTQSVHKIDYQEQGGVSFVRWLVDELVVPSLYKRFLFFLLLDAVLFTLSLYLAFLFHFNHAATEHYTVLAEEVLPFFLVIKLGAFYIFRVYGMTWRYVGIRDMVNLTLALFLAELFLAFLSHPGVLPSEMALSGLPKPIIFMDGLVSLVLAAELRLSKRMYLEILSRQGRVSHGKTTLIVGAGNTGEMILRDMMRQRFADFYPIGFLDDSPDMVGRYIHGVKVLGETNRMAELISRQPVEAVIIAITSLNHKKLTMLYETARKAGVETIKVVPRLYNFDQPEINMKALEDISIEDLIGRQTVTVDFGEIGKFLQGRAVMITGAGGSIGSEIVRQVCSFRPGKIILFDIDETELHNLALTLNRLFPSLRKSIHFITGDVKDVLRLREVFSELRPEVIFHAAAYKHVPMMEYNPKEAVKVNIFGTWNLVRAAVEYGVEKFVMISTDKAVRPTSVMGATKRMAEHLCRACDGLGCGPTRFVSVRFGNVLGSRGSVLPLFLDQLKHGQALTVTHREMKRYFMTIPEAVTLVLQASVIGNGGEVLVLDMGEPVKISDLAEELIRIHGLEPYRDIDIKVTGLRPGEKLFEEILTAEEGTEASRHEKIFVARNGGEYSLTDIEKILMEFHRAVEMPGLYDDGGVRDLLRTYVKHYEEIPERAEMLP